MQTHSTEIKPTADRYAACVEASRRIRWDIDKDVFRGRALAFTDHFMPDGLSQIDRLDFLGPDDRRRLSQVQGRTYANLFGLCERFINAKVLELSREHWFGDQVALEALVGFSHEELKHQELFRRLEEVIAAGMAPGYALVAQPNDVAGLVLGKSTWAVLALTCHIVLFTLVHYKESIEPDPRLSPLLRDVFLFHWKEESQHAILDELEWRRVDATLTAAERDQAVDDFIALVGAVDAMICAQAVADVAYFRTIADGSFDAAQVAALEDGVRRAYRWQYIGSGAQHPRFLAVLTSLITSAQAERIMHALAPILA